MPALTMIGADEALALVLSHASPLAEVEVPASEALGLTLVGDVLADRDYPPFDRSVMDGFAVQLAHAGRTVAIRGEARPGRTDAASPYAHGCVEIMTGSPCPPGTEAVVMKEEVRKEASTATFPAVIERGQNIVPRGAECRAGAVVLPNGARLTPLALGLLATTGIANVRVRPRPSLALIITGDEVVAPGEGPSDVEIRDSNGPVLEATARALGVTRITRGAARDTPEALAAALDAATADIVVLTGGVSAGNYDLVPAALVAHGADVVFHKVRQQPGKPILFATRGSRLFFGLPGTPLGSHMGFHRYVGAAVRALAGQPARVPELGVLERAWRTKSDRRQFILARVIRRPGAQAWTVSLLGPRGSSDLFTPWAANAYVSMPEETRAVNAGAEVSFDWLDGAE